MVGIKHSTVKNPYPTPPFRLLAVDWNADHVVDELSITLAQLVQEVQDLINGALQTTGGTLTGNLFINGANLGLNITDSPTGKQLYLQGITGAMGLFTTDDALRLGGVIRVEADVPIQLPADPLEDFHAATKQYVDNAPFEPTLLSGMIMLWAGAVVDIPTGWHLCDGAEGTPDLRNKFIIGAGDTYAPDDEGGANSHSHAITSQITGAPSTFTTTVISGSAAAKADHTHYLTGNTASTTTLPLFYALCYIMKL